MVLFGAGISEREIFVVRWEYIGKLKRIIWIMVIAAPFIEVEFVVFDVSQCNPIDVLYKLIWFWSFLQLLGVQLERDVVDVVS